MPLIDNIKIDLSDFHKSRIQRIDDFDYSKVARKVSKDLGGLPGSYLADGIENLKLYYVVALLDPLNAHAVSRPVDPFWHSHTLFTRDYIGFCKSVFGQYVHHEPLDEADVEMVEKVDKLYDYTVEIYREMFRRFDSSWWSDRDIRAFGPVCLHQELVEPDIRAEAKFPAAAVAQIGRT